MRIASFRSLIEWSLMVALVLGAGVMAQAQQEESPEGKVVKIGRPDGDAHAPKLPPPDDGSPSEPEPDQLAVPRYWIGMLGSSIPAEHPLRAHLDLPEDQGLLVANVVPDSPAAKAGLKVHDILLRANDTDLHEMQDLVELVVAQGPKQGTIVLDILRHNKPETVNLAPEERPANAPMPQGGPWPGRFGEDFGPLPNEMMEQFGGRMPMPFQFRNFGDGTIVGRGMGMAQMPNGVSVNIQKQDGKPTRITVQRGKESWEIVGDDPDSLKQLPDELRPFVEQLLHGGNPHAFVPKFDHPIPRGPMMDEGPLRDRLERMERRLEELQERFGKEKRPEEGESK
ncbi:MAG: PDZ domain-containing protein [Pirellulales bacterium]|nr:PDZ domain-containing protein [Pirellulales bacterium]